MSICTSILIKLLMLKSETLSMLQDYNDDDSVDD